MRSSLEFACCVWSPHYDIHVKTLEKVQHKYLRFLAYKFGIPFDRFNCDYNFLENKFSMMSLINRRQIFDVRCLYKCLNFPSSCPDLYVLFSSKFFIRARNTRQNYLFYIPHSTTNYSFYSPIRRIMSLANSINSDIAFWRRPLPAVLNDIEL